MVWDMTATAKPMSAYRMENRALLIFDSSPPESTICTPATAMRMTAAPPAKVPRISMAVGSVLSRRKFFGEGTLGPDPWHPRSPSTHCTGGGCCAKTFSNEKNIRAAIVCRTFILLSARRAGINFPGNFPGNEKGWIQRLENEAREKGHQESQERVFKAVYSRLTTGLIPSRHDDLQSSDDRHENRDARGGTDEVGIEEVEIFEKRFEARTDCHFADTTDRFHQFDANPRAFSRFCITRETLSATTCVFGSDDTLRMERERTEEVIEAGNQIRCHQSIIAEISQKCEAGWQDKKRFAKRKRSLRDLAEGHRTITIDRL